MKYTQLLVVAILATILAIAMAAGKGEDYVSGDYVHTLNGETFTKFLEENEFVLVEFYAPWCPHCKKLAGEIAKAAEIIAKNDEVKDKIKIADLDCDQEKELCSGQQIPGFPTMKLFKNGRFYKNFEEGRQTADIVNWLLRKCGPSAKRFENKNELNTFVEEQHKHEITVVVGEFKSEDSEGFQAFRNVADVLDDFAFVEYVGKDVEKEQVTVRRYWSNEDYTVEMTENTDDVAANIKNNGYPLVDEVSAKTFKRFADSGLPIAVLFVDYKDEDLKNKQIALVNKAAKELQGKMAFGYSNGEEYGQQLEMMGGNAAQLPGLAAMDIEKRANFPYPVGKELTEQDILEWASGVVDGSIKPYLKSQDVPENAVDEDGVTVVVGKSFNDIVMDTNKDVLIEFYAPWCGHCKQLAPIYSKVATYFKDIKNLVIAKIDATENDVTEVQVQGFPTLFFFPSNQKQNPVNFNGDRTTKGLKQFIAKNAVASKSDIVEFVKSKKTEKTKHTDL